MCITLPWVEKLSAPKGLLPTTEKLELNLQHNLVSQDDFQYKLQFQDHIALADHSATKMKISLQFLILSLSHRILFERAGTRFVRQDEQT